MKIFHVLFFFVAFQSAIMISSNAVSGEQKKLTELQKTDSALYRELVLKANDCKTEDIDLRLFVKQNKEAVERIYNFMQQSNSEQK
jgi:hypothetical protein